MPAVVKFSEVAAEFVNACRKGGWKIDVGCNIISIRKRFAPNDNNAYIDADGEAFHLLAMAPLRGGSVWGTDGGSVGGHVGLTNGYYELKKSGSGKRFLSAVVKILYSR